MGTPDFAVPALDVLARRIDRDSLLVVTQPDRAAGRGRKMQPPPVKSAANRLGVDVMQVQTLRRPEVREQIERFAPDLVVVAAFGLILPRWLLRLPNQGCVNLHASLLPRFRGASPVAAAIACGDAESGVALMEMEAGLDTGGVYATTTADITPIETTESLTASLAMRGAELLDGNLDGLMARDLEVQPQHGTVIETRKLVKAHGVIDWSTSAVSIERHIRAMWSWPRAWTVAEDGTRLQVHAADVMSIPSGEPGTILGHEGDVLVATGESVLRLTTVQLAGRGPQPARKLVQHPAFAIGSRFGNGEGFTQPDPWIIDAGRV